MASKGRKMSAQKPAGVIKCQIGAKIFIRWDCTNGKNFPVETPRASGGTAAASDLAVAGLSVRALGGSGREIRLVEKYFRLYLNRFVFAKTHADFSKFGKSPKTMVEVQDNNQNSSNERIEINDEH
jgi:hypothetical protein